MPCERQRQRKTECTVEGNAALGLQKYVQVCGNVRYRCLTVSAGRCAHTRGRNSFSLKTMMMVSGALGALQIGSLELARAEDSAHRAVDASWINDSDVEAGNWLSYGWTYNETRYSPLALINNEIPKADRCFDLTKINTRHRRSTAYSRL